jgi:hypothetical protein
MLKHTLAVYFLSACFLPIFGQKPVTIELDNPSFEDEPSSSHTPKGWFNCGFMLESEPDTHPTSSKSYKVDRPAFHGLTYLGMVVRDNNTWEGVKQTLKTPLSKDSSYSFSLYLCRSKDYLSVSAVTKQEANFNKFVVLRIWAVKGDFCKKVELLSESKAVSSIDWEKFDFMLKPREACSSILLEAYYETELFQRYNGNILIDNASAIVPILDKND